MIMFNRFFHNWFFEPTYADEYLTAMKLGILDPKILDEFEYEVLSGRQKPAVTIGMEIEQNPHVEVYKVPEEDFNYYFKHEIGGFVDLETAVIERLLYVEFLESILVSRWGDPRDYPRCQCRWDYDGSGPAEWSYGISKMGGNVLKLFLNDWLYNKDTHYIWQWHSEYEEEEWVGCGSHVHIRPSYQDWNIDPQNPTQVGEIWACAWNTAVTLLPFLLPYFLWEEIPRGSSSEWAIPFYKRYSPATIYEKVRRLDGRSGRDDYNIISLTGITRCPKPLTIEIRIAESHPAFAIAGAQALNKIIAASFKRGFISPKVTPETERKLLEIERRIVIDHEPVYGVLEDVGPIYFLPGRGLPGVKRIEFVNAWDVTQTILKTYLRYGSIWYGRWTVRVAKLLYEKGIPAENDWACWRIMEDKFTWEEPEIRMDRRK